MSTVVSVSFTRPVHARELRPGDIFAFPEAPTTALTVVETGETPLSAELTLATLTLMGCQEPLNLPSATQVRVMRMVRTVTLDCLLCGKAEEIELNLPKDGEPLSLVCADHSPEGDAAPAVA
ncbi:hypothetical protein [Streptomyces muensis]|uniref:Uncharacterized protein n=1 Tax=Streptomyces muensis TaxID=1077944 RepID=A0A9X1PVG4_STRM4|nr:hypothetical protein [Streptomyces muensis]MCF1592473.1 hypothetical protein [Streptomyces muensis]